MEYCDLEELIDNLEYGTRLHVGVVFLGGAGNKKCILPHFRQIHSKEVCEKIKKVPEDYEKCFGCRNRALHKAIKYKEPFGGLCINGIYEYTRPVLVGGEVAAVIFIGNILTEEGKSTLLERLGGKEDLLERMEPDFGYDRCEVLGNIVEGHIRILLEKYPVERKRETSIIENVKSFILSNLEYDLKLSDIATLFHYNGVYLGKLFKEKTGKSIKEYLNEERIRVAKEGLKSKQKITYIAQRTGFNSASYFNRVFKRLTGVSPSEYVESEYKNEKE